MDTSSPFLAQILPSYLLCGLRVSWWASIHWLSCQKHRSTYETFLVSTILLFSLTLLLLLYHPKPPIPLLLSLPPLFFSFLVFSASFFSALFVLASFTPPSCFFYTSFFFSSSFCFCYPNFPCFSLHCFSHFSRHLVILISPVLQSISGLWYASHGIPKIMFHF